MKNNQKLLLTLGLVFALLYLLNTTGKKDTSTADFAEKNQAKDSANQTAPKRSKTVTPPSVAANAAPSVSSPQRQPAEDRSTDKKLIEFLNSQNSLEKFSLDQQKQKDQITVRGGEFLVHKSQTQTFVKTLSQLILGGHAPTLLPNPESTSKNTSFSEVIEYDQYYKNFRVENSSLKILRRNADQRVYYIASNLKTITNLDENIQITQGQASQTLISQFDLARSATVTVHHPEPVIYFEAAQPQLCWKLSVALSSPIEEREIFISVKTGKIISSAYSLVH